MWLVREGKQICSWLVGKRKLIWTVADEPQLFAVVKKHNALLNTFEWVEKSGLNLSFVLHWGHPLGSFCRCSSEKAKAAVLSSLPILTWLPSYPVKEYLFSDVVSGLSTGVVQLPQGQCPSFPATLGWSLVCWKHQIDKMFLDHWERLCFKKTKQIFICLPVYTLLLQINKQDCCCLYSNH